MSNLQSTQAQCAACNRPFQPQFLPGIKRWSTHCGSCSLLNLAKFLEEVGPDDTVRDISMGEQSGAWLRAMCHPASLEAEKK